MFHRFNSLLINMLWSQTAIPHFRYTLHYLVGVWKLIVWCRSLFLPSLTNFILLNFIILISVNYINIYHTAKLSAKTWSVTVLHSSRCLLWNHWVLSYLILNCSPTHVSLSVSTANTFDQFTIIFSWITTTAF